MKIPRFLICAGASGSGKTLITCGLLQALKNRGKQVASFKCGPDYIDPMFHTKVIGTKSRNLDTFFVEEPILKYLLSKNCKDMDIAVMEGVMGYYDGVAGITSKASAYEVASMTKTPAVLIVNCKGMSVSIIPYIKGFLEYKENSQIKGVILNQMSAMLYPRVKKLIEEELDIQVIGYVPKVEDCVIESRHLGLILPDEMKDFKERLEKLAKILEETIDMEKLLVLAESAPELEEEAPWDSDSVYAFRLNHPVRIGIAKDEAFCFIYEDNLELLRKMGAELVEFSPIHDKELPKDLHGLIFYGGYPELFAEQLEKNDSMKMAIKMAYENEMPIVAECGGFMYLHETMEDMDAREHEGVGIIKGKAYKTPKLGRFGYISLTAKKNLVFEEIPAHEFHYFDSTSCGNDFVAKKPFSSRSWECIHLEKNLLAGFPHFYYYGNPNVAKEILKHCQDYKDKTIQEKECEDETGRSIKKNRATK